MAAMVEKSMDIPRTGAALAAHLAPARPPVIYGITGVRYEGTQISEVLMGMLDPSFEHWDLRPAPTRLVEVVDRLVEGDTVIALFPAETGLLHAGPEVKVDVLPEGTETLALTEESPGRRLRDLPRF